MMTSSVNASALIKLKRCKSFPDNFHHVSCYRMLRQSRYNSTAFLSINVCVLNRKIHLINIPHRSNNSTWRWRWKNFHIKKGLAKIIMSIPEITASSHTSSSMEGSRITRLYSMHEVVLEYSVVIITLGCFLLISLSSRLLKGNNSCQCLPELCY